MIETLFCIGYALAYIHFAGAALTANTFLVAILATAMIIGLLLGDGFHTWHQRPRLNPRTKLPDHKKFARG
jgi:hypothetical protein